MTIEATASDKKNPRRTRGNTTVDNVTEALVAGTPQENDMEGPERNLPNPDAEPSAQALADAEAQAQEDRIVQEARQAAGNAQATGSTQPAQVTEEQTYNPFKRSEGIPTKPTLKVAREEAFADRSRMNQPSPSTKRLGALGKKLPGAERAKVHKRVDTGALAYVGEYTDSDLSQSQDIESFLNKYIKPVYGPGEYQITGVDAHAREFDMGFVTLLAPLSPMHQVELPSTAAQNSDSSFMKQLMDKAFMNQQEQQRRERDPIKMLGELHELKSRMDPPPPPPAPKDNNMMLAVVAGLTQVATALVSAMTQPKPQDPLLALLLAKMLEEKPRSMPMAPPPPMPPPIDPTEQLRNMASVLSTLRGTEAKPQDDRLVEYLTKDRLSPADVLSLVNQVKGERGTDDFKKSMENMGIMFNAITQLKSHTEAPAGSGMWDAIGNIMSNPKIGDTVASIIRSRDPQTPARAPQNVDVHAQNRVVDPVAVKAREVHMKRLHIEEQELEIRARALQANATPAPAATRAAPTPSAAPLEAPTTSLPKHLPPNIAEFINRYVTAKDEAELVGTTVDLVIAMHANEEWNPYAQTIIDLVMAADKKSFLRHMFSMFSGLNTIKMLEIDMVKKILNALNNNFPAIVEAVTNRKVSDDDQEPSDDNEEPRGDDNEEPSDDDEEPSDDNGEGEDPNDVMRIGNEEPLS